MAKWKQNRDSPLSTYKIWTEVMKTHKKKKGKSTGPSKQGDRYKLMSCTSKSTWQKEDKKKKVFQGCSF